MLAGCAISGMQSSLSKVNVPRASLTAAARGSVLCLALALTACATVDFQSPKTASTATLDTYDTRLGKALTPTRSKPNHLSGFLMLVNSIDALTARLMLAERAERSIDAQYYMVSDDIIGRVFLQSLMLAADRGVQVRLLIDDQNTSGMDTLLAAVADHPNISLRLFNPYASRKFRAMDVWDFSRLNRRMHNKSFTIDNQVTIVGGRNIATEYFALNPDYNFGDLDTMAIGPVVRDTSIMFDRFWNHERAVPFTHVVNHADDKGERYKEMRENLANSVQEIRNTDYADAVRESYEEFSLFQLDDYIWAPYEFVYDSPDKALTRSLKSKNDLITTPLGAVARNAERELLIMSPYFVALKPGIEGISALARKGVQIDVVTNGLAASDHLLVYGGYAPVRKPLLREGVRFYEVRGDITLSGTRSAGTADAKSSLHTKAFIADRRYFFLGSFNWDPRSANINTEMGILIDAPDIADRYASLIYQLAPTTSYEVFLEGNSLRWRTVEDGKEVIYSTEPESSWWTRTQGNLFRLLPIRSQL